MPVSRPAKAQRCHRQTNVSAPSVSFTCSISPRPHVAPAMVVLAVDRLRAPVATIGHPRWMQIDGEIAVRTIQHAVFFNIDQVHAGGGRSQDPPYSRERCNAGNRTARARPRIKSGGLPCASSSSVCSTSPIRTKEKPRQCIPHMIGSIRAMRRAGIPRRRAASPSGKPVPVVRQAHLGEEIEVVSQPPQTRTVRSRAARMLPRRSRQG